MNIMSEIKQANFRIKTEDAEAFRAFCEEKGLQQAEGFAAMLQAVEMANAKQMLSDRTTEIANFEAHINAINAAYLFSLELNENAEDRIRGEFERLLKSKDDTIIKYQEDIAGLKEEISLSQKIVDEFQQRTAEVQSMLLEANKKVEIAENRASDKEKLADALALQLDEFKAKSAKCDELVVSLEEQKSANNELRVQLTGKEAEITTINAEAEKAAIRAELKMAQALAEKEKQHSDELSVVKDKFSVRENELRDKIDTLKDEREKLNVVNSELKAENEQLNALISELNKENEQLRSQLIKPNVKQAELEEPEQMEF